MNPLGPPLVPPGHEYLLGTDAIGQSVAIRLLEAVLQTSLIVGTAVLLATAIGLGVGLLAGSVRLSAVKALAAMLTALSYAVPLLIVLLLFYAFLGDRWIVFPVVAGFFVWGGIALATQTRTEEILPMPFVLVARVMGAGPLRLTVRHILPNILGQVWAAALGTLSPLLQVHITLSFLAVGGGSNNLGALIREGYELFPAAWWLWVPATVTAIGLLAASASLSHRVGISET